jgi:hypothetical protein
MCESKVTWIYESFAKKTWILHCRIFSPFNLTWSIARESHLFGIALSLLGIADP